MAQPTTRQPKLVTFSVERHDGLRWLSWVAGIGVLLAIFLAVIGGFPFDNPMPTHSFGWVEPTCGLTRGSTAIARGNFALAWRYNPASFLVMGFGAAGVIRLIVGTFTDRWLNVRLSFGRRRRNVALVAAAVLLIAWWAYQQANAEFIINSRA